MPRSPKIAGLLSAVLPGLGQLYNRQWSKGIGFLLAALVLDAALGISNETMALLQAVSNGARPSGLTPFVLKTIPFLGIAVWSVIDAARVARKQGQGLSG